MNEGIVKKVKTVGKVSMFRYNPLTSKQAIVDTGCTYHYYTTDDLRYCTSATENG